MVSNCLNCGSEHNRSRSVICIKCSKKKYRIQKLEKNKNSLEKTCEKCDHKYKEHRCRRCYNKEYHAKNKDWINPRQKEWKRKNRVNKTGRRKQPNETGFISKDGYKYITVKGHPNAKNSNGQIAEHKFIMCQHLGRFLFPKETVHHKNGIRHDNRIENLELWSSSHPSGQRIEDKVKWAIEFLNLYGYKVVK